MISVAGFKKVYGTTWAVRGLSVTIQAGQVWGLVGHNGAGKTTSMRAIAGLLAPTEGSIHVAGFDVSTQVLQAKSQLAYLPDDPQLFDALTVGEHLQFTAAAYRIADFHQRGEELLEFFELSTKVNTPAEDLSRGMRQKLAICCAYLHDPQVILFDEPFTGLDPKGIRRLKESIRTRSAAGGAIMVSSHLLAMVEDLCTHFLVLAEGTPTFSGTREELLSEFRTSDDESTLEEIFFHLTDLSHAVKEQRALEPESLPLR